MAENATTVAFQGATGRNQVIGTQNVDESKTDFSNNQGKLINVYKNETGKFNLTLQEDTALETIQSILQDISKDIKDLRTKQDRIYEKLFKSDSKCDLD